MLKKILGPVFLIIAVIGGAVAADFVKSRPSTESAAEDGKKSTKDAKDKKKKDSAKGDDGKSGGSLDGPIYLKFKRQFVVPVMKSGEIDALVIMNLNYELDDDAPDNIYTFEPKLRDAIVRELLRLSDKGIFGEDLTTPQSYELLRSTLLEAGQKVVSEGIRDVLILDIARQDQ